MISCIQINVVFQYVQTGCCKQNLFILHPCFERRCRLVAWDCSIRVGFSLRDETKTKIGNVCLGAYPCPLLTQQKDFRFRLLCGTFPPVTSNIVLHTAKGLMFLTQLYLFNFIPLTVPLSVLSHLLKILLLRWRTKHNMEYLILPTYAWLRSFAFMFSLLLQK